VDLSRDLRQEVAEGLLYAPSQLSANTSKTLEASSFLYALIELLSEKGPIGAVREGMLQGAASTGRN